MKKVLKVTIGVAICSAVIGGTAWAQLGGNGGHKEQAGKKIQLLRLARALEVDEAQAARIRAIIEENKEALIAAKATGAQAKTAMAQLVLQGSGDEQALRNEWIRQSVKLEESLVAISRVATAVKAELTAEQLRKLDTLASFLLDMHTAKLDMITNWNQAPASE